MSQSSGSSRFSSHLEPLDYLAAFVEDESGVHVEPPGLERFRARVKSFCRRENLDLEQLVKECRRRGSRVRSLFLSGLINGETSFFRDDETFRAIAEEILPALVTARRSRQRLNIWSAACSSGQEAYSLAILVAENRELVGWDVKIHATDIADERLSQASTGRYSETEVNRGLSHARRASFTSAFGDGFEMTDHLKQMVRVSKLNLLSDWSSLPQMDLVLVRNAMMYWNLENQRAVARRVCQQISSAGYLVLGAPENWDQLSVAMPPVYSMSAGIFGPTESARGG